MREQATKLIESAQAGTLPADLVRGMIYQGRMPHDHVIEGSNPYKDGMAKAKKDHAAGKDLKAELEKLRKVSNPNYSFLGGYEKVVRQQKGVRIDWPANSGYLYKTSSGYKFERDKGHATAYRGSNAKEKMRYALVNTFNIPSKQVDAAIKKAEGMKESLDEGLFKKKRQESGPFYVLHKKSREDKTAMGVSNHDSVKEAMAAAKKASEKKDGIFFVMKKGKPIPDASFQKGKRSGVSLTDLPGLKQAIKMKESISEVKDPNEEKAWKTGQEYAKKTKMSSVKDSDQMYKAARKAGVPEAWFDVFKYGAQDVWRKTGQQKKGRKSKKESVIEGFDSDESAAYELQTYIDNDGNLYRQMTQGILKNLATKKARGDYSSAKAVKAFMYLVDEGAKRYVKAHGGSGAKWHEMFPKNIRTMVAKNEVEEFEAEYEIGNYDDMLPKKYRKKNESLYLGATGVDEDDFVARTKAFLEQCPGSKIRSKGKGRGLGIGKGKGPIGVPAGEKDEDSGKKDEDVVEVAELYEGEVAFLPDTPEHITQFEELVAALDAAQVPISVEEIEDTGEVIVSWGEGYGRVVDSTLEALGISVYDDNDLTPEAGVDYRGYVDEDLQDFLERAATFTGKPHMDLPNLFQPRGEEPRKKPIKRASGLTKKTLARLSKKVQQAHAKGQHHLADLFTPLVSTESESEEALTARGLIDLHLQGQSVEDLFDEVSKKELLARFGDKKAKPFKKESIDEGTKGGWLDKLKSMGWDPTTIEAKTALSQFKGLVKKYGVQRAMSEVFRSVRSSKDKVAMANVLLKELGMKTIKPSGARGIGEAEEKYLAYVGVSSVQYPTVKNDYEWFLVGEGSTSKELMPVVQKKVHGSNMTSHIIKTSATPIKKFKGTGPELIKKLGGKSVGGVGGSLKSSVIEARKSSMLKVGDKVRYSSAWLRNTGQITGPVPFMQGVVIDVTKLGNNQLVSVDWKDGQVPSRVLASNLHKIGTWEPN